MTPKMRTVKVRMRIVGRRKSRERCSGVSVVVVEGVFSLLFEFGLRFACSFRRVADIGGGGKLGMLSELEGWFVTGIMIVCENSD